MIKRIAEGLRRRRLFFTAIIASLLAVLYWSLVASDRYVSEAHIIVQRSDITNSQSVDIGALIGTPNPASHPDQLLLRDYLRSVDMLKKLDAKLNLKAYYSDSKHDWISRLWSQDLEWFHRHYQSRVSIELDELSGALVIKATAYDSKMALAIAGMLVAEGERFMNAVANDLARVQVAFLEKEVTRLREQVVQTRQTVLAFQDSEKLVSPQATAENFAAIVGRLESQLVELQTRRAAMVSYLMGDSPSIVEINQQIAAVEKQIMREKSRLTTPEGKPLNRTVEKFQLLQMNAEFALEVYKTALAALETGRYQATRTLKKVTVLQSPFEPQYAIEPRRMYNSVVFLLISLLIAGITRMIGIIIRDHQD